MFEARENINQGTLPQQTKQTCMYTSFFKRERQYDPFRAKEIINRRILAQQTSQKYMYTSFFKRERQYDPFRANEIINRNKRILAQQTSQIYMYNSFFKRERQYDPFRAKEIINRQNPRDGYCHNKQARYTCILRSLSVSYNMIRFRSKEIINRRILPQQTRQWFVDSYGHFQIASSRLLAFGSKNILI